MPRVPTHYWKVEWSHQSSEDPVLLYSELDSDRRELRKVEVYADGRMDRADAKSQTGSTFLSVAPLPNIEAIRSQEQFEPESISATEFEAIWRAAIRQAGGPS